MKTTQCEDLATKRPIRSSLIQITQRSTLKSQRKNVIYALVVALILVLVGSHALWNNRPAPETFHSMELASSVSAESHMLVVGDMYFGRRMNDWSQQSKLKESYPFSRLTEFNRGQYDAWIGNLECPSVSHVKPLVSVGSELAAFNCDPAYLPNLAKWFTAVSLANNHTQNQGREQGLAETRAHLDTASMQYFGNFDTHVKADVCEVISLPMRMMLEGRQQNVVIPVAMCGFDGVYYTVTDASLKVMQEYAKVMPVFAYPHMGQEYQALADETRRELYRKMIDSGADVVLGNHPHWVQPTEVYKDKLIVYSMGNFIFDQDFSKEVMRSAAIDITMSVSKSALTQEQLRAWVAIGKSCGSFHDDCLAQAQQQQLPKLPIHLQYNVIGVDTSNKITKPANMLATQEILERLNWEVTKKQLAQNNPSVSWSPKKPRPSLNDERLKPEISCILQARQKKRPC